MFALFVGVGAWFQCKENLYNYKDRVCLTALQCKSLCLDGYAYKAIGRCLCAPVYGKKPPTLQKDGSYECENNFYLKK